MYLLYPSLLHKMAPLCMNTAKKNSGQDPQSPFKQNSFISYYTHKYWENHYQNIPATKYVILRASNLQNVMQNIESHVLPPLLNPRTNPPPPPPRNPFFFCFFKNLLRLKINILSSVYPEINFLAEPVMKMNNLSRPNLPAPPPPSQDQMVVPLVSHTRNNKKDKLH